MSQPAWCPPTSVLLTHHKRRLLPNSDVTPSPLTTLGQAKKGTAVISTQVCCYSIQVGNSKLRQVTESRTIAFDLIAPWLHFTRLKSRRTLGHVNSFVFIKPGNPPSRYLDAIFILYHFSLSVKSFVPRYTDLIRSADTTESTSTAPQRQTQKVYITS